jgi:hypothetical protein
MFKQLHEQKIFSGPAFSSQAQQRHGKRNFWTNTAKV